MTIPDLIPSAFAIFADPGLFSAMLTGVAMGMIFGATPGLNGKMGILLLLPLLFGMDPKFGVVLLLSMHAVVHTGGSIPSIMVGVPGGAPEAATVLDGFAMAKKGAAAEALGASMAASGIGGALGAIAYFSLLPIFAVIGNVFGAPEFLVLALLGLCAVATLSEGSPLKGFTMGALGLLAGTIGLDYATGTPRYTFGQLELWDGLDMVLLVTGLFAVPEVIDLFGSKGQMLNSEAAAAKCTYRALFRGMAATWTHRWLTLRTTILGILIGMMPGLGAEVASWLAYGHAVQSAKDRSCFGRGTIEGVIAPETANNSKEGGSLLPTVAFGIPGSSTMALMMAGLAILGIPVGPTLLTEHGDMAAMIGWSVFWSNLVAVVAFLAILPIVGKIVYLRIDYLAPAVLAIAVTGALIEQIGSLPLAVLFVVSTVGCYLVNAQWPRAPFLLAFIMGQLAETNLVKSSALYGWEMFTRWPTLILSAVLLYLIVRALRSHRIQQLRALSRADVTAAAAMFTLFAAAAANAFSFSEEARLLPLLACSIGAAATGAMILTHLRANDASRPSQPSMPWRLLCGLALFLVAILLFGILPASFLYVAGHAMVELRLRWQQSFAFAAAVGVTIWLLFGYWLQLPLSSGMLW